MEMKLPAAELAWVEEPKIKNYLLNVQHSKGSSKARFFLKRGFSGDAWTQFQNALITQGKTNPVVKVISNEFGTRYIVECHCPTPDNVNPCIRTVWEITENTPKPRLITAHPL
jgi:hypothetical protein